MSDIAKYNGIEWASIAAINGIEVANIASINGSTAPAAGPQFPPSAPWTETFTGDNGSLPDTLYWTRGGADAGILTIQDNQCNSDTNGTAAKVSSLTSKFNLSGDFDVEFEFQLHTYGTGTPGTQYSPLFYIKRVSNNDVIAYVSRGVALGRNGYISDGNIAGQQSYVQADATGKLRVTRVGNGFYTYMWSGSQWEWDGAPEGRYVGSFVGENMYINLFWTNIAGNDIEAAIDNFKINSGTPVA
jgi:hypothetical protein